jgi:hypothetical protein
LRLNEFFRQHITFDPVELQSLQHAFGDLTTFTRPQMISEFAAVDSGRIAEPRKQFIIFQKKVLCLLAER